MPSLLLAINSKRPIDLTGRKQKEVLRRVANALNAELSGAGPVIEDFLAVGDATLLNGAVGALGRAAAVPLFGAVEDDVDVVIDGTTVTVTTGASPTATAALMVAAINADATASTIVTATHYVAQVTLASVVAGTVINVCGYDFTATAAASSKPYEFDISGNDTADALAFTKAVNAAPGLLSKVRAVSAAGVVYLGLVENRAPRSSELVVCRASTLTINAQFLAGVRTMVVCRTPGLIGNACTLTVSGTGMTVASNVTGKLGGGTGGMPGTLGTYLTQDTK